MEQTLARSMARILFAAATAATAAGITACGGGGSSPAPAPAPAPAPPSAGPTADEGARFLTQATFGPTESDIAHVQSIGYSAWIDEQFAMPATSHLPYVQANQDPLLFGHFNWMQDSFWQQAIPAQDQLRQRVKFALSELVVTRPKRNHRRSSTAGHYADLSANTPWQHRQ